MKDIIKQVKDLMFGDLKSEMAYRQAECFRQEANKKYLDNRF